MATVLITVPHTPSHVLPALPIADALVKRGHRVLFHTDQRHAEKIQAVGAELIPMPGQCDIIHRLKDSAAPIPSWLPKFPRRFLYFRHEVLAIIPDMISELEDIVKRERVDCLIGDLFGFGAPYAAERLGIPYATLTISWPDTMNAQGVPLLVTQLPLPIPLIQALINFIFPLHRVRKQMGLPPRPRNSPAELFSVIVSRCLNLVACHREFLPPGPLQENQVFMGPTTFHQSRSKEERPYGEGLDPNTVMVSHTTSTKNEEDLFRFMVESVAQLGVPVLAVSGGTKDISLDVVRENVRLEKFVPYDEVMPYVRAVVTFGGCGTTGNILRAGVPALLITDSSPVSDVRFTGVRAEELGLAYHLPKPELTREALQTKVKALLADQALRERVMALAAQLDAMDPPGEIAAIAIERLLPIAAQQQELTSLENSQSTHKLTSHC